MTIDLKNAGCIIDLDGTVYAGLHPIQGAVEAIKKLQDLSIPFVFLSNRGNYSREMCKLKLLRMGIDVAAEQIILSSSVTAQYLSEHHPEDLIWPLGDAGLEEELCSYGLHIASTPNEAQWVVITLHESLTYHDLNMAFRAVRSGAKMIATNADRMFPAEDGDCIDVAGMIGALVYSTGQKVSLVMGKPSTMMANAALRQLQLPPEQCIVIGDSLATDIQLGKRHGMNTVLVLTGSVTLDDLAKSEWKPDVVVEDLLMFVNNSIVV